MRYLDLPLRNFPSCSLLFLQTANTPKVHPEKLWMKSHNFNVGAELLFPYDIGRYLQICEDC